MSRMNLPGYVGHVTIGYLIYYCMLFSSKVMPTALVF